MQDQKDVLETTAHELEKCKKFLTKEHGTNSTLKQELHQFKVLDMS